MDVSAKFWRNSRPGGSRAGGPPRLVGGEHMVGVALLVFARDDGVFPQDAQAARIPTGAVGGRLGNKGAAPARVVL